MGKDVTAVELFRQDNPRYRRKVRRCLDALALMLDSSEFDSDRPMTGLEIELDLVDPAANPAMRNEKLLADLADPRFQTELGQFNLELNVSPRLIAGDGFATYERDIIDSLRRATDYASKLDLTLLQIGILPTFTLAHAVRENLSSDPRYRILDEQILTARGEDIPLDIQGAEQLRVATGSIAPEAAGTSVQCHLQLTPDRFAAHWNASQAIAGVQVAVGANSPFLFGRQLWAETRIALFEQSTDSRPEELRAQGVRPRAWFGERWIESILDLFAENVRYFPPLLPRCEEEDPLTVWHAGDVPHLMELRLHNGTIFRWNRPVYDVTDGRPHLRVENRVLPSGPTVPDLLANAAFYLGLIRELATEDHPVWHRLPFAVAERNFYAGARHGLQARLCWPQLGELPVPELVLRWLLPTAYAGLDRYGVAGPVRDRLLGIIEQRCLRRQNGAVWQAEAVRAEEARGRDRPAALHAMLQRYADHQRGNAPVHTWPVP